MAIELLTSPSAVARQPVALSPRASPAGNRQSSLARWLPATAIVLAITGCGDLFNSDDGRQLEPLVAKGNSSEIRAESAQEVKVVPTDAPTDELSLRSLEATNAARAAGQRCGDVDYPPVGPVQWHARVAAAALLQSEWMQQANSWGHAWPDGTRVGDRLTRSDFNWARADENIAAGFGTLDGAIRAWIDSPPHCRALMRADLSLVGIAVVPGNADNKYSAYWTMVLAEEQ